MSVQGLVSIRKALTTLNPQSVRDMSHRQIRLALYAADTASYQRIEDFLLAGLSQARRLDSLRSITRGPDPKLAVQFDLVIYDEGVISPSHALVFRPNNPDSMVSIALSRHEDLGVALARTFSPFRKPFIDRVVNKTCRENALFSLATALPDIVPSIIELPWAIAEFATDTAFLTMNQIRMAFLIAAASDRSVGYAEQKSEIATVIGSAFGWRALARQLIGKVPFGGGLLPKAGVAWAGTKVLGISLEHLYSIGYVHTDRERKELYADAFEQGKKVAAKILAHFRPDLARKFAAKAAAQQPSATSGAKASHVFS